MAKQVLIASGNNPAGSTLLDTPWIQEQGFPIVNNHLFLSQPFELLMLGLFGKSVTASQISTPTWDAIQNFNVYPPNLNLTVPSNPQVLDFSSKPIPIPTEEEVKVLISNNLSTGTEYETLVAIIRPTGSGPSIPPAPVNIGMIGKVRAILQATVTLTAGQWSPYVQVSFQSPIRGGVYTVLDSKWIVGTGIAYKYSFNRTPMYNGIKLFPGGLTQTDYADIPLMKPDDYLGAEGQFDTVALPQISFFSTALVGSATYNGYVDLLYNGPGQMQGNGI